MNEELILSKIDDLERQVTSLVEVNREMYQTLKHIERPKIKHMTPVDKNIVKIIHAGLKEDLSIKKIYKEYKETFKDEARHMSSFYRQWNKHRKYDNCIMLKCRNYQRPFYSNLKASERKSK